MTDPADLPYRPCVGVMLVNRAGLVFIGKRAPGGQEIGETHAWQMPQGGLDKDEDPYLGALRELHEETNIRSVEKLGESRGWVTYDLPAHLVGVAWKGRFRGQTQKWFALRFTGEDAEIDVAAPGGFKPEFEEWRWERLENLMGLIVPFKRAAYQEIIAELGPLARP